MTICDAIRIYDGINLRNGGLQDVDLDPWQKKEPLMMDGAVLENDTSLQEYHEN